MTLVKLVADMRIEPHGSSGRWKILCGIAHTKNTIGVSLDQYISYLIYLVQVTKLEYKQDIYTTKALNVI